LCPVVAMFDGVSGIASEWVVWYFLWEMQFSGYDSCFEETNLKTASIVVLCAAVLIGLSAPPLSTETGANTIQFVYHSDTRGYYLPCG
jgi:hypothetical protein